MIVGPEAFGGRNLWEVFVNGELWVVSEMTETICNPINESNLGEE